MNELCIYKISVIIPAFQAEKTIARAIFSALDTSRCSEIELIIVDDCSKDISVSIAKSYKDKFDNIRLFLLPKNCADLSSLCNFGISKASGVYLTILEPDCTIDADRLLYMVDQLMDNDYDFVKGYLKIREGSEDSIGNRLSTIPNPGLDSIRSIVEFQSMKDYIIRTDFMRKNGFQYRSCVKFGEDLKLVTEILSATKKVAYIDDFYLTYVKTSQRIADHSSRNILGDLEILNQISSWISAQKNMESIGINFFELRLAHFLQNLFRNIIWFSNGISKNGFTFLSSFVIENRNYIDGKLLPRYKEIINALLSGDFEQFMQVSKKRLLISGYDLKFILSIIPFLKDSFHIRIDRWTEHNSHNRKKSVLFADWADIIWCEWMLRNAVFYANKKNKFQRLVVHAHRFEIAKEFGHHIDFRKVDAVFAVSYYFFEEFINTFSIPREKMRLLSNYIDPSIKSEYKPKNSVFHVGLIGVVPSRKGLLKGLQIIKKLVASDTRYKLHIFGKKPKEYEWVANNPKETDYFDKCDQFITENGLQDNVIYEGFRSKKILYKNLGFVLSLSDSEPYPESFHLAPAEGAAAGCMTLILDWPGVEYIYPKEVVYKNLKDMADDILRASCEREYFKNKVDYIQKYVKENFHYEKFIGEVKRNLLIG